MGPHKIVDMAFRGVGVRDTARTLKIFAPLKHTPKQAISNNAAQDDVDL